MFPQLSVHHCFNSEKPTLPRGCYILYYLNEFGELTLWGQSRANSRFNCFSKLAAKVQYFSEEAHLCDRGLLCKVLVGPA